MQPIHVAITGTGFMGQVHAEALKRLPGVRVLGIHGSTPEKSRLAADRLELPKSYDSFADLVADPEVHAVHVTTPNRLHYPQTVAALRAGKHVLCEKPLAMTSEETADLVRLAETSGVVTGVNYNIRFNPLNLDARERVAAGEIGPVHAITGSYQQDWLLYDTDYNWRVLAEEQGELRALADIGTHWLDLVQFITGQKLTAVLADLRVLHPVRQRPQGEVETFAGKLGGGAYTEPVKITTDDLGTVLLRFEGATIGSLFVSQVTPGLKNSLRYEIAGAKACLQWNSENPNVAWRGYRDRPNELAAKDPSLMMDNARRFTGFPGGHPEGFPDTFKMCFRAFHDAIRGEGPADCLASFADGHREVLACDAILRSHREQRWVTLES